MPKLPKRCCKASVDAGADLIVSGSYGNSRLHEWAFGGATWSLLNDSSINRLITNQAAIVKLDRRS